LALVITGRSGSDFFQSLLDSHSQIAQLPGNWDFHQFWQDSVCKDNHSDLAQEFIWYSKNHRSYLFKFESKYDLQERMDCLGENQDQSFSISRSEFSNHLVNILSGVELNSKNMFLAVHLAYELAKGVDPTQTKLLFYHVHHVYRLKRLRADFPDTQVLCNVRDPRNLIVSGVNNWKKYDENTYRPKRFNFLFNRILTDIDEIFSHTDQVMTLKLENIHAKNQQVFKELCDRFELEHRDSFYTSTFNGLLWWGDRVSTKAQNGFNPNFYQKRWKEHFCFWDELLFEVMAIHRLNNYQYPVSFGPFARFIGLILFPILVLLPMKYELSMFAFNLGKRKGLVGKLRQVFSSFIQYTLRVKICWRHLMKRLSGNYHLVKSLAD
jgi:hypothetical protein